MRRLMLLRHAKSDRPAGVSDIDRPLNPRGRRTAPLMGAYLAREGLHPDHVVVSPACRTRETWDPVRLALDMPEASFLREIYEAPASALLAVIRAAPADATTLLMIGHNPGLQDIALQLVGAGLRSARNRIEAGFPTGGLAVIDFTAGSWHDLTPETGRLERFVVPRDLDAEEAA